MSNLSFAAAAALSIVLTAPTGAQSPVVVIDAQNYSFLPRPIRLAAGRPVTLSFVNRSRSGHDFTAPGFFAYSTITAGSAPAGKVMLPPHAVRNITLIPRAGTYRVHCSHFLHSTFGMTDLIVVN
jgi:plastocyanin